MLKIVVFILALALASPLMGQELVTLRGTVLATADDSPLKGATVKLVSVVDSSVVKGGYTEKDGTFKIKDVPVGAWRLTISFVGFKKIESTVFSRESRPNLGTFKLSVDTNKQRELQVEAMALRVEVKGDTTEYNANAYKTNPNATAEDLVKKMPGITVEGGTVKAQGEEVRRVTVDGREFFGDDASATLKNMPADMVDRVQVFDRGSDLSMFSGFDDGNTQKQMNVVTKKDKRNGSFGRGYAGGGDQERYAAGVTINDFREMQRVTVLGLSNNINQQNFSFQDILGASGMAGSSMGRMMSRFAGSAGGSSMLRSGGGGPFSSFSNFFVGQQGGISTTNALGLNYSDQWTDKTNVASSYFFNYGDNSRLNTLDRTYITPSIAGQQYDEGSVTSSLSRNHRISMRIESVIDSANIIVVSPRVNYQSSSVDNLISGTTLINFDTLNTTSTDNRSTNGGYTASVSTTYRHSFPTKGRTIATTLSLDASNRWNGGTLGSSNAFRGFVDTTIVFDQRSGGGSTGTTVGGQVAWTEPMGEQDLLQLSYEPSITQNSSTLTTNTLDPILGGFTVVDTLLSNAFDNTYQTHRAGALYRLRMESTIVTLGSTYQHAILTGNQTFPSGNDVGRTFDNILPTLMVQHKFSQSSNLRVFYRTSTSAPSVNQLQNVVDNSNPLQLRIGNSSLVQSYNHSFNARLVNSDWLRGRTMFGMLFLNYTANYIGSSSTITQRDTTIGTDIVLGPGAQITAPVNIDGFWNARGFFTYSFPVLGANLNMNTAVLYTRTPGLINNATNYANSTTGSAGFFLGSANSEDLDVSVSYNASYTWVANTLQRNADDNYFTHVAGTKVVWNIGQVACSTDVAHTMYQGLGTSFNRLFTVWNAGIGYRFLDRNAAEIRISVFDILNQNDAINRTINDVSIEDSRTNALRRYFMVSFSYDLKTFTGGK